VVPRLMSMIWRDRFVAILLITNVEYGRLLTLKKPICHRQVALTPYFAMQSVNYQP